MMRLAEVLPEVAQQLERGLEKLGEPELAANVSTLEVVARCDCGDRSCGTFYTVPKDRWLGQKLRQVIPEVPCLYALDVWESQIVCVEVLGRPEIGNALDTLFPSGEKR